MSKKISIINTLYKQAIYNTTLLVITEASKALCHLDAIAGVANKRFTAEEFSRSWEYYHYPLPKKLVPSVVSAVEYWDKKYPKAKKNAGTASHVWARSSLESCNKFVEDLSYKLYLAGHPFHELSHSQVIKVGDIIGLSYALDNIHVDDDGSEIVDQILIRKRIKLLKLIAEVIDDTTFDHK